MDYEEIIYDVVDSIATITLNRPEKLNAWTVKMEAEYRHAMAAAEASDEVRVIIVTGAGRGFCAGADMSLLTQVMGGEVDRAELSDLSSKPGEGEGSHPDYVKQYSFPVNVHKPILCAINGAAVGIGLVHTLYCDIRFASDKAKFGTIFSQRGLVAEHGSAWMLPRLIGIENALDLFYSGRIFDAQEAQRLGLVSRVVPHDELMERVREYATMLATQSSPSSMAAMKREVYAAVNENMGASYDATYEDMMKSFGGADFKEGVASFMEKRPATFTGK